MNSEMSFCPKCKKWEIGDRDAYCSWCGEKLVGFEVSLSSRFIYWNNTSKAVNLTIKHTGPVGYVVIEKIEPGQPWLKVDETKLGDRNLRQGTKFELPIEVQTLDLPAEDYYTAEIMVISSSDVSATAKLEIIPNPEFQPFLGDYTIQIDRSIEEAVTAHLVITRGVTTITEISTDVDWAWVKPVNQTSLPFLLDARNNNKLDFEIVFDSGRLLDLSGDQLPADFEGHVIVKTAEWDDEQSHPFYVKCFKPPQLQIPEESIGTIRQAIFLDKRAEISLTLQNGAGKDASRRDLQINGIENEAPGLKLTNPVSFPLPLVIPSGKSQTVNFTATANDMGEGVHIAKIVFLTNQLGAAHQKDVFIEFNVARMRDFEGAVAIDFGTSNSCCAFFDRYGQLTMVDIDLRKFNEQPKIAPSTIWYKDKLDDNKREYEIGRAAYDMSFDPHLGSSTVRQIKRFLGKSEPRTILYSYDRSKQDSLAPREITADIIARILERAEEFTKARIKRCVISHPSRFSIRQIEDLKAALVSCGIKEEHIRTMHEPFGAAIDYIHKHVDPHKARQFHLMVYDFGGGTTDITLLKVSVKPDSERGITIVTPQVLGATGDRWLGGEDITELLMEIALKKCERVLEERYPKSSISIPLDLDKFTDPGLKDIAFSNRNDARNWAEETKIAISLHKENHSNYNNPRLSLKVIVNDEVKPEEFRQENICPQIEEFDAEITKKIKNAVEMMRRLAHNNDVESPDVILLSGQSSALSAVRDAIQNVFKNSEIPPTDNPTALKECVVTGACQLHQDDPIAGLYIDWKHEGGLSATTSRLGVRVRENRQIKFKQLIDAGVPIPAGGLKVPVKEFILKRDTIIRLLENTSLDDELMIGDKVNPNINELKAFHVEHPLLQLEKSHGLIISDQMLFDAEIELEVTPNLTFKVFATIQGIEHPLEFEVELTGW